MDFIDKFVRDNLPNADAMAQKKLERSRNIMVTPNDSYEESVRKIKSTTTIFAFKYDNDDGVIIAADRRTSSGFDIFSDTTEKIHPISPFSAVAFCGTVYTSDEIKEQLTSVISNHISQYGFLSIDGQVKFLSHLLRANFHYITLMRIWGDIAIPIFAGFDPGYEISRIFYIEPAGSIHEKADFVGEGCGWPALQGLMSKEWKRSLTKSEAIVLAVNAMYQSGVLSHGVSHSEISPPNVLTIDREGISEVDERLIKKLSRSAKKKMEKNRSRGNSND